MRHIERFVSQASDPETCFFGFPTPTKRQIRIVFALRSGRGSTPGRIMRAIAPDNKSLTAFTQDVNWLLEQGFIERHHLGYAITLKGQKLLKAYFDHVVSLDRNVPN
jgi:predicted transcriptional regulator